MHIFYFVILFLLFLFRFFLFLFLNLLRRIISAYTITTINWGNLATYVFLCTSNALQGLIHHQKKRYPTTASRRFYGDRQVLSGTEIPCTEPALNW